MSYEENEFLNDVPTGEPLLVRDFNKKEVEEIARAACPRGFDIDNFNLIENVNGQADVENESQILEAVSNLRIPITGGESIDINFDTGEKIWNFLRKIMKDGFLSYNSMVLPIAYLHSHKNSQNYKSLSVIFGTIEGGSVGTQIIVSCSYDTNGGQFSTEFMEI